MVRRTTKLHQLNSSGAGKAPGHPVGGGGWHCGKAALRRLDSTFATPCRLGARPYPGGLRPTAAGPGRSLQSAPVAVSRRPMAYLLHCNAPRPTAASTYRHLMGRSS